MIKIVSNKLRNVITKDGNKLSVRKTYQVNKFEFENKITPGIILYIKSIEEIELYKNDKIWYVGCVVDERVFLITYVFNGFVSEEKMTVKQAINLLNNWCDDEHGYKKFILLKSIGENLFIPKIDF